MIQFACKSNTCTWTPGLMARKSLALSGAMLGACQRWNPDENGLRMNGERGNRGNRVGRAERSWRRKGGGGLAVWDWLETHHTVGTLRSTWRTIFLCGVLGNYKNYPGNHQKRHPSAAFSKTSSLRTWWMPQKGWHKRKKSWKKWIPLYSFIVLFLPETLLLLCEPLSSYSLTTHTLNCFVYLLATHPGFSEDNCFLLSLFWNGSQITLIRSLTTPYFLSDSTYRNYNEKQKN